MRDFPRGILALAALALAVACSSGGAAPPRSTAIPAATSPPAGPSATTAPSTGPRAATGAAALRSVAEIPRARAGNEEIILATTTSTQDSGLLDVLVPMFERATGYRMKPIAVGTGQALALGARGEADVVLVHAPSSERAWMAEGNGTERRLVMYNDFVVVGPPDDPAQVAGSKDAASAFAQIAATGALFMSRGDASGTEQREIEIWKQAGVEPKGQPWYQQTGQGMGATLSVASEKAAYTLTDRATFLARQQTVELRILNEGAPELLNIYHVMPVNPARFPRVNAAGGLAFADFLVSQEAQAAIGVYGEDKYGQPLFFPSAGRDESSLGR